MRHRILLAMLYVARPVVDAVLVYASYVIGYYIYFFDKPTTWAEWNRELAPTLYFAPCREYHYLTIGLGVSVSILIVFATLNLYCDDKSILHVREYRRVLGGFIAACLLFLAVYYFWFAYLGKAREKLFSRRIFAYSTTVGLFGILCARAAYNQIKCWLHRKGIGARRVLVYGAGVAGKLIARRLSEFPAFGLLPVGFVDDNPTLANTEIIYNVARGYTLPVLGTGEQLRRHVMQSAADEVLVAIPSGSQPQLLRIISFCTSNKIAFRFIPNVHQIALHHTSVDDLVGIPIISLKATSQRYLYRISKRIFDIIVSAGVVIILSPMLLLISIVIRLETKGSPMFLQTRIGLHGKPFRMLKFRTMHAHVGAYEHAPKQASDPRITEIGRWLRRTSLDELPQVFNVLAGTMSLVGPRPEMPFIAEQYDAVQRERLTVKPGITGLWQISADRRRPIHENMDYDLYYIQEQSFLLDIVILVETAFFAFRGI